MPNNISNIQFSKVNYEGSIKPSKNDSGNNQNQNTQTTSKESNLHFGNILPTSLVTKTSDMKMYYQMYLALDGKDRKNLEKIKSEGKLNSRLSNDGSSTLENLYKIYKEPRADGLENKKVLSEVLQNLTNPYIIHQKFGKVPDFMTGKLIFNEKMNSLTKGLWLDPSVAPHYKQAKYTGPISVLKPEDLNVETSATCVATSIEFNLAMRKPAEYVRYAAGLTSPKMEVKSKIKLTDISPNIMDALYILNYFQTEYKPVDWETVEVTVKPDSNALSRAQIQSKYRQMDYTQSRFDDLGETPPENYKIPPSRSSVDSLMQSAFMQLGSQNTYNSLNDMRAGEICSDPKGLIEFEKTYVETIVEDDDGGITSITYQNVDDNKKLQSYFFDYETTKKHLLETLALGRNVIVGITYVDNNKNILGGHEMTVIGSRTDANGELYFITNDTDDDFVGTSEYRAKDFIPTIHHAGIPNKVLNQPPEPEAGYVLLNELAELKKQNQLEAQKKLQAGKSA